ncbi:hypothetical protein [Streptomyces atratus]|uniref:hypothetical protein n=1 Tax=Streptomyces atratus TaxID=1893 RepID=UPI0033CB9672
MGGVDVAVAVEQVQRGGHRAGQGRAVRCGPAGVVQQAGYVAHPTGEDRPEVRRLGQPPGPLGGRRTQLGGAHERCHRVGPVAAPGADAGGVFEQGGDLLVGFDRGLRQVTGPLFGHAGPGLCERTVGAAALVAGGQVHHRGAHERVPERQPPGGVVDAHEPEPLRGGQVLQAAPSFHRPAHDQQVAAALQRRHEQEVPGGRRQTRDPGGERRLQALGQRNALGQGAGRGAL